MLVVRGGSWNNNSYRARSAYRNRNDADNNWNNSGFRVVLSIASFGRVFLRATRQAGKSCISRGQDGATERSQPTSPLVAFRPGPAEYKTNPAPCYSTTPGTPLAA